MPTVLLMCAHLDRILRLSRVLQCEGYCTLSARSLDLAKESLKVIRPDAIVVDLPDVGEQCGPVCRTLCRVEETVPVILLAHRPETVARHLQREGLAADVLPGSPFSAGELADRLRRHLSPTPLRGTDYGQFDAGAAPAN